VYRPYQTDTALPCCNKQTPQPNPKNMRYTEQSLQSIRLHTRIFAALQVSGL